jgi:hypothetical protein
MALAHGIAFVAQSSKAQIKGREPVPSSREKGQAYAKTERGKEENAILSTAMAGRLAAYRLQFTRQRSPIRRKLSLERGKEDLSLERGKEDS